MKRLAADSTHPEHLGGQPYFPRDYRDARERFVAAADTAGATLQHLPLTATGPDKQSLGIDIAHFGSTTPHRLLIHSSGIHGVEGFAGSAIQLALLDRLPPLPSDGALVLVHILNPFGMAWLRRVNESNVDLNRNFLGLDEAWSGAPAIYPALDPFLNPPRPPRHDPFLLKALACILRYGFANMKRAVAAGQYDHPRGLFYGGSGPEEGPRLFRDWLTTTFPSAEQVFAIDVHTGLGPSGVGSLLLRAEGRGRSALAAQISRPILDDAAEDAVVGYPIRGSLSNLYREHFGAEHVTFLTQEFGTRSNLAVLKALRAENQHHHYGEQDLGHWSKRALADAFASAAPRWRQQVVSQGCQLVEEAGRLLFGEQQAP